LQQAPTEDANQTTVYPSIFKLRNEMPVQQERPPVGSFQQERIYTSIYSIDKH